MVPYNDRIAGRFLQATLGWGLLGLLVGIYAALELQFWPANGRLALLSFGRLQPIHSNLMVYAFAGNAFFAGLYYALQRLCQIRVWSDRLAFVHFWGWQLFLLGGFVTLGLGYSQSRPLAEMEWPLDLFMAFLWSICCLNFFMTLKNRRTEWLYISIWFFVAGLLGFGLFHSLNALAWPVSFWQSYPLSAGLWDALLQASFAQNIRSFLLTIPFLGLMYYFVPKVAKKPLHSYQLAVVQFWTLVFLSVWTGPAQLLYTSLPEWLQSLGLIMSLLLLAPSWAAVLNGLFTIDLRDRKLMRNPAVLFFTLALLSYGLVALMEAIVSFKSINRALQYTDWMSAQHHLASMGWIGSFIFGMAYVLVPKLWQHPLYSRSLGRLHFGINLISVLIMVLALAAAGVIQSHHWLSIQENGLLVYPEFIGTLQSLKPFHTARLMSGGLMLFGALLAAYNFYQTARRGRLQDAPCPTDASAPSENTGSWLQWERRALPLALGTLSLVLLGTLLQFLPLKRDETEQKPFSPLVLEGQAIYQREGCVSCHTQMVRMTLKEELRYGPASQFWEYQEQRPTLWGQRRHGPDLHRIGGKFPDVWHYHHLINPQATAPGSLMPAYPGLARAKVKLDQLPARQMTLQKLGVAVGDDPVALYQAEAKKIQENLASAQVLLDADAEIIALIAYLQNLGTELKQ